MELFTLQFVLCLTNFMLKLEFNKYGIVHFAISFMSEEISQNQGTRISTPITRISTPITRISALITLGMKLALYLPKIMSISLSIRRQSRP